MMKKSIKKLIAAGVAGLALTMVFAGCSGPTGKPAASAAKPSSIEVTDIKGNTVTVPGDLKKIAVTPIPWASVTYFMDGNSDRLAAIHPAAMSAFKNSFIAKHDKNFANIDTKIVNSNFSINAEAAANAGIQAAVLWQYQDKDAEQLKKIGIAPVLIYNDNIEDLKKSFTILGKMLGKEDRAQKINAYYDNAYNEITSHKAEVDAAEKPTILFLRTSKLRLQGNDNFVHQELEIGGAHNPMDQVALDSNNKSISMEQVYEINPDIIFLSNFDTFVPDDLYQNKIPGQDWSTVKAVQNHRVYKVPLGVYRWDAPGVETPLMMKWVAHVLQPTIFKDIDIKKETRAFYKDMLNIDVTDEDLAQIFHDKENADSQPIY